MYLLFIDEFGHENPKAMGQAPVFGYGGFLIPADSFSEFSTEFFDLKVAAFKPLFRAKIKSDRSSVPSNSRFRESIKSLLEQLGDKDPEEYSKNSRIRLAVAQYEIKGSDIFSASYLSKLARKAESQGLAGSIGPQGRTMVRFARRLLNAIQFYRGEIFFVGYHHSMAPILKQNERIHVKLVADVVDRAYQFAKCNNTIVKIIFDHHYTDVGDSVGPYKIHRQGFVSKSRSERAREIVLSKGYFENLTEPIFNAKSHLSQGVQAADWICALLKILLVNRSEPQSEHNPFISRVEYSMFSNVADQATFRHARRPMQGGLYNRQDQFDLRGGVTVSATPRRPYRK